MDNYLFKFFEKEEYIDEFRQGRIRLMSAYHYATLEQAAGLYNNRYDVTEGKTFIYNNTLAERKTIKFGNGIEIELGNGIRNIVVNSGNPNQQIKLSCYYTIDKSDVPDGKFKTILSTMEDSLGEYYIFFTDPAKFANKIEDCMNKLKKENKVIDFSLNRVTYYDVDNFNGFSNPFKKPDGLSWQREYRLAVNTVDMQDPFYIDIGNISDITIWGKFEDLKQGYIGDNSNIFIPNYKL